MYRTKVDSPIGDVLIEGNDEVITKLGRIGKGVADGAERRKRSFSLGSSRRGRPRGFDSDEWVRVDRFAAIKEAAQQLDAYWSGELFDFDLPLAPGGTPFQNKVWAALRTIPYGKTASYGDIARKIGSPTASRAVGAANGRNPIAIVVPCHRVIGANGTLTGYAGGLDMKRELLAHETRFARS